jgi:hypothetical protein
VPSASPGRRPDLGPPGDPAWPANPASAADADVYVYRDDSDPAPSAPARARSADDAAYWYDPLSEDPIPARQETRGPFEPLVSSSGGRPDAVSTPAAGAEQPGPASEQSTGAPERARKLEQLKDLYLTAEAIGEQNVDKHFDQLLAQQRELISGYFRQSSPVQPDVGSPRDGQAAHAEPEYQQTEYHQTEYQQTEYQQTGAADGPVTPPEGVSVRAEPPRAW